MYLYHFTAASEDSNSDDYDTVYDGTLKEDKSVRRDKQGELMKKKKVLEVRENFQMMLYGAIKPCW